MGYVMEVLKSNKKINKLRTLNGINDLAKKGGQKRRKKKDRLQ